ncbi:MAG: efflux RND transporter periplasmic adaptor subunit [Alphaproteobacteria bacterium]
MAKSSEAEAQSGQPRKKSKLRSFISGVPKGVMPFAVIGGGVVIAMILIATAPKVEPEGTGESAYAVAVVPTKIETITPQLSAFGSVIAGRQIDLRSHVAGEIVWRAEALKDGGTVTKGDVLVQIDPFDYETQLADRKAQLREARAGLAETKARVRATKAQLEKARTQLKLRKRDYDRAKKLKRDGTVSQKYLDQSEIALSQQEQAVAQAESELEIADARMDQQRATISRLERSVTTAERNLDHADLKAPFSGVAAKVYVDLGKRVSPNEPIATLIDTASLEVRFTLPSVQFGRLLEAGTLEKGAPILVRWRVGGATIQSAAWFDRVGAQIDTRSGGVDLYAKLATEDGKASAIRAGAFVEVVLDDRTFENVVRLPEDALYHNEIVYTVNDESRLVKHIVDVLAYNEGDVIIRGSTLPVQSRIMITRLPRAGSGVLVDIRSGDTTAAAAATATAEPQSP